jgi:hypothetical protein
MTRQSDPHAAERRRLSAELGGDALVAKASFPIEMARQCVARKRAMVQTGPGSAHVDQVAYARELLALSGQAAATPHATPPAPAPRKAAPSPTPIADAFRRGDHAAANRELAKLGIRVPPAAPTAATAGIGELPPNPELDRLMGLAPPVKGTSFDPKSQTFTFGGTPRARAETPEEAERRRAELDREMGLAGESGPTLSADGCVFTFGKVAI